MGGYVGFDNTFANGVAGQGSGLQTLNGAGVYATNPAANYTSMYAQSTGAANVAASIQYSNVWIADYAKVDNSSAFTMLLPFMGNLMLQAMHWEGYNRLLKVIARDM